MPAEPGESSAARSAAGHCTCPRPAGLLRRFAAAAYDAFVLFGVLFVATAILLPFTGGQAVDPENAVYLLYLLAVSFLYFGWFWTHGGQTLGMRAWHIRVRPVHGATVPWKLAALRFLAALLSWGAGGTGFLWAALDTERRSWHDRLSRTVLEAASDQARLN